MIRESTNACAGCEAANETPTARSRALGSRRSRHLRTPSPFHPSALPLSPPYAHHRLCLTSPVGRPRARQPARRRWCCGHFAPHSSLYASAPTRSHHRMCAHPRAAYPICHRWPAPPYRCPAAHRAPAAPTAAQAAASACLRTEVCPPLTAALHPPTHPPFPRRLLECMALPLPPPRPHPAGGPPP